MSIEMSGLFKNNCIANMGCSFWWRVDRFVCVCWRLLDFAPGVLSGLWRRYVTVRS